MEYKKYNKFEELLKESGKMMNEMFAKKMADEIGDYYWLNKGGIYKINSGNKVEPIDEKVFRGMEFSHVFIDEAESTPISDEVYNLLLTRIKPMKNLKKEKVKKLTPEQKLKQENAQLLQRVEELEERESYLEKKIESRDKDIADLGDKMNQNADLYQEREAQNRREVERLMEIIRWQIKPEAALKKETEKTFGRVDKMNLDRFPGL